MALNNGDTICDSFFKHTDILQENTVYCNDYGYTF